MPTAHAELVANILMPPALDIVQNQHGTCAGRQQADGALQLIALRCTKRRLGGVRQVLIVHHGYRVGAAGPDIHQRHVDRQPIKPSAKCTLMAKIGEFLPCAYEGFLRQIFRTRMVVSGQPKNRTVYLANMQVIQALERLSGHRQLRRGHRQRRWLPQVRLAAW